MPPGELPDRLHLLRLAQRLLGQHLGGDVAGAADQAGDAPVRPAHRDQHGVPGPRAAADVERLAVGLGEPALDRAAVARRDGGGDIRRHLLLQPQPAHTGEVHPGRCLMGRVQLLDREAAVRQHGHDEQSFAEFRK
jgi:hypothetical protein